MVYHLYTTVCCGYITYIPVSCGYISYIAQCSAIDLHHKCSIKRYSSTVSVGILVKILLASKNSVFKNHPRDILRDENHLYAIVLVHIIYKTALNIAKHLQVAGYRILNNHQNSNFSLTASLTTVARLEAKQSSAQPPFYATIINSPVGYIPHVPFGVPTSVGPLCFVFSFIFNQAACLLHPTKPYGGVNCINTFFQQHI